MLPAELTAEIEALLQTLHGKSVRLNHAEAVGGGCIHHAHRLETSEGAFFLKYNDLKEADNFAAEAKGLARLAEAKCIKAPAVHAQGSSGSHAYLLLEYLQPGKAKAGFWEEFGQALAALHRQRSGEYGLDHANYIGRLPQNNAWRKDWIDFFTSQRLEPQLQMAERKGLAPTSLRAAFEKLYLRLGDLIPPEPPSLLHGDLWSGNFMVNGQGKPAIFDPAVYFGHREAEIAFTRLFGGFSPAFYQAYTESWPLQQGWEDRVDIFNLYPLTVHLNLFGRGYLPEIQSILRRFV